MGKADIFPGHPKRSRWPIQCRLCDDFYSLSKILRKDAFLSTINGLEDFKDKAQKSHIETIILNQEVKDCLNLLALEVEELYPKCKEDNILCIGPKDLISNIISFGTLLASDTYWQRYEVFANELGTGCSLSRRGALAFFFRDSSYLAVNLGSGTVDIKEIMKSLIDIRNNIRSIYAKS